MSKQDTIRERFEDALVDGLKGSPVVDKESGEIARDSDGSVVRLPVDSSVLSVTRAYLKDLQPAEPKRPAVPATGEPQGVLKNYMQKKGLPFGSSTPQ